MSTFIADPVRQTGRSFLDISHPIIAAYVNAICDELSQGGNIKTILAMVEKLQSQMETYVAAKRLCHDHFQCPSASTSVEARERLDDLYHIFLKYAQTMPNEIAAQKICTWAQAGIFDQDVKCLGCRCVVGN